MNLLIPRFGRIAGGAALLAALFGFQASAEIDHRKLKGVHELLRSEYQFLSPVYGFSVLKKGILENLYRYGPNEDRTVKLIQLLFHSVEQTHFGPTRLPTAIASHLDTDSIGSILRELLKLSDTWNADSIPKLEGNLLQIIHKAIGLDDSEDCRQRLTNKQRQILRRNSKNFTTTLLEAAGETLGPERKYPAHFVDHILLGLFWAKAKDEKSEFLKLLTQIPQALTYKTQDFPSVFTYPNNWSNDNYTFDDYARNIAELLKLNSDKIPSNFLLLNPELTAYLSYSSNIWDRLLPQIFSFKHATFNAPDGRMERFADCGETSIRNFFNIALKDHRTQILDPSLIKIKADEQNLKISPEFLDFYERNSSLSNLGSVELHDQWAQVVSGLPKVSYKQPEENEFCNITDGLNSVLRVFENLLFSADPKFSGLRPEDQLDQIARFLSRPDFELSWDLLEHPREELSQFNTGIIIKFSINKTPSFTWRFSPGHFVLSALSTQSFDWRKDIAKPLAEELTQSPNGTSLDSSPLILLSWFVFEHNLDSVLSLLEGSSMSKADQQFLLWSTYLKYNPGKLIAIVTTLKNQWTRFYPLIERFIRELPLDAHNYSTIVNLAIEKSPDRFQDLHASFLEKLSGDKRFRREVLSKCIEGKLMNTLNIILQKFGHELANEAALTQEGRKPLHEAISRSEPAIIKLLLEAGADPKSTDNFGTTALHFATLNNQLETMKTLVKAGADINAQDQTGNSVLHYAATVGEFSPAQFLVQNGASLELLDDQNRTALDRAQILGNSAIQKYLIEMKAPQGQPLKQGLGIFETVNETIRSLGPVLMELMNRHMID